MRSTGCADARCGEGRALRVLHRTAYEILLIPEIRLFLQTDGGGLEDRLLAQASLRGIVVQRRERRPGEDNNDRQVYERHHSHENVGHIPDEAEFQLRADKDRYNRRNTEDVHRPFAQRAARDVV